MGWNPFKTVAAVLGNPTAALNIGSSIAEGAWSAKQAKRARDWELRASSTAHQREVADLRAAGLNPILSATGGPGATTPNAPMPETPRISQTALQASRLSQELENLKAQEKNTVADTTKKNAETVESQHRTDLLNQQIEAQGPANLLAPTRLSDKLDAEISEIKQRAASGAQSTARGRLDYERLVRDHVLHIATLDSEQGQIAWLEKLTNDPNRGDIMKIIGAVAPQLLPLLNRRKR